ncbi:MAG: sensor N-terminal transmembrane domain-containing protein [Sphingomonadaceae bacterium]|nr:sensor N-terminal transmembrane domain-containing protein [Sphingomonadaceae bacterium]
MAPVIASPTIDAEEPAPRIAWRGSLTRRILAVNLVALALVGGSVFYLDGFRSRLIDERRQRAEREVQLIGTMLALSPADQRATVLHEIGRQSGRHLRVYDDRGALRLDSWRPGPPTFTLVDPAKEPWRKHVARWMDTVIDTLVGAESPPPFVDAKNGRAWPEVAAAAGAVEVASRVRNAPDRTLMISAATRVADDSLLLSVENARELRRFVRAERSRLALIVLAALLLSAALSFFLARTIVRPLRRLARAAVRVRLGRAREVVVPRLPSRGDEIGLLARAVSDMTQALRERIDAIESFAADVTHELKNPLASLSSAVESLGRVDDPALRAQLLTIIGEDVRRLDRLITDVAEVSRLDAQLTRAPFARVDLGEVIEALLADRAARAEGGPRVAFARPLRDTAVVMGDAERLARVVGNLLDNALSFSPEGGVVRVGATRVGGEVLVTVEDEGPGVPEGAREAIFRRFHSDRPDGASFGHHSGLGLAIARTIVDGHNGTIEVRTRESGEPGARFVVRLPAAEGGVT